jgi:nicotinate-nucleotide pyrophosphorylase (carboxylating)
MAIDGEGAEARDPARGLADLVARALDEDVGDGDRTTLWTVPPGTLARARIVAKESLVVAGAEAVLEVLRQAAPTAEIRRLVNDGIRGHPGDEVAVVEGPARALLTAERTALNFMGRLSGIATLTAAFVERIRGTGARIVDTRKTTPGWRALEKAAVRAGGGENHRMGLYDMVLIKENHIRAAGGIQAALAGVQAENHEGLPVEIEVEGPEELAEVAAFEVDRILLDNFELGELREAVATIRAWPEPRPLLEASGNMTLERVRTVAETGVDLISVGALTHSAPVADLSMLVEEIET